MENVIELNNVSKRLKAFSLESINLQVKKGLITGFIGENGAGKTTTIKLMMNLLKPDQGEVKVFGLDYQTHEKEIKDRIGFVYDENIFFEGLNLKDIKRIIAHAYKRWDDKQFDYYIEKFELPLNKAIKTFSKGMKMKASLSLALAHHPELIIMDEPTAGLDPVFRQELLTLLQDLITDENRTIFFSTHITTDLDKIADYISFMQGVRMLFYKSKEALMDNYAIVKGDNDLLDADTEKPFLKIDRKATGFTALTDNVSEVKQIFNDEVLIEQATLEEIMYYSKKEKRYD